MALAYDFGTGDRRNWIIAEADFDPAFFSKVESIFALGNGYMGLRAATEERYAREGRGFYAAGLFDAFPGEVTELPNLPDWLSLELSVDGERVSCASGKLTGYVRYLDLRSGELVRSFDWQSPRGRRLRLRFERFVSLAELHSAALRVTLEALDGSMRVFVESGINGQVTNSGVQHLREGGLRLLGDATIATSGRTLEADIDVCVAAAHRVAENGRALSVVQKVRTGRRRIDLESELPLEPGRRLTITKHAVLFTGRDLEGPAGSSNLLDRAESLLRRSADAGYDAHFERHAALWEAAWRRADVEIEGSDFDQLAIRFALFHLLQMTPTGDPRASIAAKGLSGEGYKGHVFWDTEIFMLPLFIATMPETARELLGYRYRTLDAARAKAKAAGFRGAMYPWESADTGEDTTPPFAAVDIVSGRPIPVLSGKIEQHISVDVPYAVLQYEAASGDEQFLIDAGLEILLETARFWESRLHWNGARARYEILDVMGPDEYGEHVDNNAYTNYMVKKHLERTVELYERTSRSRPGAVAAIAAKIGLRDGEVERWAEKADAIFTNIDEESGFITQYDGFTEKRPIDLSSYHGKVGAITRDYGWEELMTRQVTKQADAIMLLYLYGNEFTTASKRRNWDYYEPRTLHDSSLSPAIHAIVAADIGAEQAAYAYFERSSRIDLGAQPTGSDDGLHAAALGGTWQAAVNGFGGVRLGADGVLRISPRLPRAWKALRFPLVWRGRPLSVAITRSLLVVDASGEPFAIETEGELRIHPGAGRLEIALRNRPAARRGSSA